MSDYNSTVLFKEWLPDLPDFGNPGLTEAKNAIPLDGSYRNYSPLLVPTVVGGSTLNARCQGALAQYLPPESHRVFAGTDTKLYVSGQDKSAATYNTQSTGFWKFAFFEDDIIATNGTDVPQYREGSSIGNFATLGSATGTAPAATHVETIGQFLMLGKMGSQLHVVRWSGIGDYKSWPTPGSATAIAQQSGEQELVYGAGDVTGIVGGDQFGLIFQESDITRVTYVGGNTVFQFDAIAAGRGTIFPNGYVSHGALTYFVSADGFFVTDGVQVMPIGNGKVDRYFQSTCDLTFRQRVYAAVDRLRRCVLWCYPTTSATSGRPNRVLIYNYEEKRWSRAEDEMEVLTSFGPVSTSILSPVLAWTSEPAMSFFKGTPGSAVFTTGEMEPNAGGYSRIQAVRGIVDATVNAMTFAIGTRDQLSDSVTYTAETTANSRTRLATFRNEGRYHRIRSTIAGTFNAGQGTQFLAEPSGEY